MKITLPIATIKEVKVSLEIKIFEKFIASIQYHGREEENIKYLLKKWTIFLRKANG